MKTNGARFLESLSIPFELREYEVDPDDLSAITVAKKIGMPAEQVFKTLLVTGGPGIYRFAVVPGDAELDFKKLAKAAGLRKAEMAPLKDVQPLTGYIRGGVTLFGARKAYPVYIDETAILFDKISVSAGARGTGARSGSAVGRHHKARSCRGPCMIARNPSSDSATRLRAPSLRLFVGAWVEKQRTFAGICGFPPISQSTRKGRGTEGLRQDGRCGHATETSDQ